MASEEEQKHLSHKNQPGGGGTGKVVGKGSDQLRLPTTSIEDTHRPSERSLPPGRDGQRGGRVTGSNASDGSSRTGTTSRACSVPTRSPIRPSSGGPARNAV